MVLDRDSRNQLINAETQAPWTVREDRVIGGLPRALRQLKVARGAVAAQDVGRRAFVTRVEPSDFAAAARALPLAKSDLLKIGVQFHRMAVLGAHFLPPRRAGK